MMYIKANFTCFRTEVFFRVFDCWAFEFIRFQLFKRYRKDNTVPSDICVPIIRLKHFNKILKEQLSELDQETEQIEQMFKLSLKLPYYATLTPDHLLRSLTNDIKEIANEINAIKDEITTFSHAPALKAWLKSYKIPKNEDRDDFNDFFLDDLMPFGFK